MMKMNKYVTDYIYTINGASYAGEYIEANSWEEAEKIIKSQGLPLKVVGELVEEYDL